MAARRVLLRLAAGRGGTGLACGGGVGPGAFTAEAAAAAPRWPAAAPRGGPAAAAPAPAGPWAAACAGRGQAAGWAPAAGLREGAPAPSAVAWAARAAHTIAAPPAAAPAAATPPATAAAAGPAAAAAPEPSATGETPSYTVVGRVESGYRVEHKAVFAVVQVGSHQFKVSPDDVIYVEKLSAADVNDKLLLPRVLLLGSASATRLGRPLVPAAGVLAAVEEQMLDAKVLSFKKRRRKNSRRLTGHRQPLTALRILDIQGITPDA